MKKVFTIVWLLMTSLMLSAAEISQDQALANARSFIRQKSGARLGPKRVQGRKNMQAVPTGMPELYAFNIEGGGYVIASADDRTLPVLGYSLTGCFDASQMPDNMRSWLEGYAEQIRMLGDASATSAAAATSDLTAIEPLMQTRWGQYAPYNLQTPVVNDEQTLTGCVATAMAQVMYYHQWPKAATTTIPAYTYTDNKTGKTVEVQGLPATTFEWDQMLTAYTTNSPGTDEQQQAVAKLMRYCGQAVRMIYGDESISDIPFAVKALREYFNYSKSIRSVFHYGYSLSDWQRLIWEELNHKRPVVMAGQTSMSSHAFVIDGYDGSGFFHVNWGYNGSGDNYFAINVMHPNYPAHTTPLGEGYVKYQNILLGVEPSTGSEEVSPLVSRYVKLIEALDTYWDTFTTTFYYFDEEGKQGNFEVAVGTKDDKGNVSIKAVSPDKSHIPSGKADVLTINIGSLDLPDGSYRLYPFYRDLDVADDSWHQMGNDREYWGVNVKDKEITFFYDQKLKITAHLEGEELAPLDPCTLVMEVENEGDDMVYLPKSTILYGRPKDKKFSEVLNADYINGTLELQPKEKITLHYPFTVPFQGDMELRLCRTDSGSPLATTMLTIDKAPHYYDVQMTDYKVVYKADETDMKKAVECTLTLKNNDTRTLSCRISARIGNDGRENGEYNGLSSPLKLSAGQSEEVKPYLGSDLEAIKEPTDLHLVVMLGYNEFVFVKLLDLNIKPGTTVTSKDATAITTIVASDADAPLYDLQGRRVNHPRKGIYIRNGKKILR